MRDGAAARRAVVERVWSRLMPGRDVGSCALRHAFGCYDGGELDAFDPHDTVAHANQ